MSYLFPDLSYPKDIKRIMRIALDHDVIMSAHEAERAWMEYSDNMCASWLSLPKNDNDVWYCLPDWIKLNK